MPTFHDPQIHSRFKIEAGIPCTIMVSKSTHIIVGLGILSLLTVAVILSSGQTTPQRSRWLQRRLIRRRPTKTPLGHVQAGNSPSGSVKNRPESETQDFDNANDAARYWTDVHDGKQKNKQTNSVILLRALKLGLLLLLLPGLHRARTNIGEGVEVVMVSSAKTLRSCFRCFRR